MTMIVFMEYLLGKISFKYFIGGLDHLFLRSSHLRTGYCIPTSFMMKLKETG